MWSKSREDGPSGPRARVRGSRQIVDGVEGNPRRLLAGASCWLALGAVRSDRLGGRANPIRDGSPWSVSFPAGAAAPHHRAHSSRGQARRGRAPGRKIVVGQPRASGRLDRRPVRSARRGALTDTPSLLGLPRQACSQPGYSFRNRRAMIPRKDFAGSVLHRHGREACSRCIHRWARPIGRRPDSRSPQSVAGRLQITAPPGIGNDQSPGGGNCSQPWPQIKIAHNSYKGTGSGV